MVRTQNKLSSKKGEGKQRDIMPEGEMRRIETEIRSRVLGRIRGMGKYNPKPIVIETLVLSSSDNLTAVQPKEPPCQTVEVSLPESLHMQLEEEARLEGISVENLIAFKLLKAETLMSKVS